MSNEILTVFNHWKNQLHHPQAILDKKRHRLIRQSLQLGYTTIQLCEAIDGCSNTPHNMGKNEQGQRYDGLHVILRDADQIDRFIRHAKDPPRQSYTPDKRMQSNVTHLKNWLEKKIHHETQKKPTNNTTKGENHGNE